MKNLYVTEDSWKVGAQLWLQLKWQQQEIIILTNIYKLGLEIIKIKCKYEYSDGKVVVECLIKYTVQEAFNLQW